METTADQFGLAHAPGVGAAGFQILAGQFQQGVGAELAAQVGVVTLEGAGAHAGLQAQADAAHQGVAAVTGDGDLGGVAQGSRAVSGAGVAALKAQAHQAHGLAAALGHGLAGAHQLIGLGVGQASIAAETQDLVFAAEFGGGALQLGVCGGHGGGGRGRIGAALSVDRRRVTPGLGEVFGHRGISGIDRVLLVAAHHGMRVLPDRHQRNQIRFPVGGDEHVAGAVFAVPVDPGIHREPGRAGPQPRQSDVHRSGRAVHHHLADQLGDAFVVPLQRQVGDRAPDRV